ncbi:MAG TPA: exodeoxyribonuclease III, partial [Gammaproteobacteria bacterium]|nr:exodeoxyribonuclease III [Gammaproteobacteria bacterium]
MKVATWNVNSLRVRLPHVIAWLQREQPDILALQETKLKDEDFPVREFEALGYFSVFSGQASYNGVAIVARQTPEFTSSEIVGLEDAQRRVLGANFGDLRLWNLYVPNGEAIDSEKYQYKLGWLAALRAHLAAELARHSRLLVVGDFNIAPEDRDVYDPVAWEGHVLCSPAERAALAELKKLGLEDLFRRFEQPERSYSWYDYRAGAFRRNLGLRIDLMLGSAQLAQTCMDVRIDLEPRR